MGVGQSPSCLREHHGLPALQLTSDVSERNWVSGCQPVSLLPLPTWLSVFLGILGPCCISWQGLQERRCFPGKELRKTPKLDSYILLPILSTDKGYAQGIETENTAKRKISPGKHHLEKKGQDLFVDFNTVQRGKFLLLILAAIIICGPDSRGCKAYKIKLFGLQNKTAKRSNSHPQKELMHLQGQLYLDHSRLRNAPCELGSLLI